MVNSFDCRQLILAYGDWVKQNIEVFDKDGVCVMTTPFLDRHSDFIQVFAEKDGEGLLLSDDGHTLRDLRISGVEITTERRNEALQSILTLHGVRRIGNELQINATLDTFPQRKHQLVQAILAVGDLIHTAQETVVQFFKEDVRLFLSTNNVRFLPDINITGKSGLPWSFDFSIPASTSNPERFIRTINVPTRENIIPLMLAWEDIRDVRPERSAMFAVLNDQERRNISGELLEAMNVYSIQPILWSEKDARISELAN
ncbi:MAG: DUF1829 domain-containing protein [Chloroflexi bacterium]|nr:DUF1829 domain-containing protein [Chloroflexota bacterium]